MTPSDTRPPDSTTPRKAVLYCPACSHDSPPGGDWRVEPDDSDPGTVVYRCPDCGAAVTNRPRKLLRP